MKPDSSKIHLAKIIAECIESREIDKRMALLEEINAILSPEARIELSTLLTNNCLDKKLYLLEEKLSQNMSWGEIFLSSCTPCSSYSNSTFPNWSNHLFSESFYSILFTIISKCLTFSLLLVGICRIYLALKNK